MKYLSLALIFGWFFALQTDFNDSGAKMSSMIGPFTDENECKAALDDMIEGAKQLGMEVRFTKCMYKQES